MRSVKEICTISKLRGMMEIIGYDVDPIVFPHCKISKSDALSRSITKGALKYVSSSDTR